MISAGERKGTTIGLKYMILHYVYLLKPPDKVHNMAAKTRKRIGLIVANSQNMYTRENSLFYVFNTLWTKLFNISIFETIAGDINHIFDTVSS